MAYVKAVRRVLDHDQLRLRDRSNRRHRRCLTQLVPTVARLSTPVSSNRFAIASTVFVEVATRSATTTRSGTGPACSSSSSSTRDPHDHSRRMGAGRGQLDQELRSATDKPTVNALTRPIAAILSAGCRRLDVTAHRRRA